MADARRARRSRRWKIGGAAVWTALVAIVGLWQTVHYSGVMAFAAEWQFDRLGHYYPSLTYLLFVLLLVAPAMGLFARTRRRSPRRQHAAALRSATSFEHMLLAIAGALFVGALGALLLMLLLPTAKGPEQSIDLGKPLFVLPHQGASAVSGRVLYGRTSMFTEDLLFAQREVHFAPVVEPRATGPDLQFFVELGPQQDIGPSDAPTTFSGILREDALPGELVRLYRYAGYHVEPPYYVLFASPTTMRWPYAETAVELALLGLVFLAVWAWQRRRVRSIVARIDDLDRSVQATI